MSKLVDDLNKKAADLVGKTIARARYMTPDEAGGLLWHKRPLMIEFTDGSTMFAASDARLARLPEKGA